MEVITEKVKVKTNCFHCGDECPDKTIQVEDYYFCCLGCKTVYEILTENQLSSYYDIEKSPGVSMKEKKQSRFDYLDHKDIVEKLLDYKDIRISKVSFFIPQIHCSACIWLLENLYKLESNVQSSRVNFLKKEVYITFEHAQYSLKELVILLTNLGYEPEITLEDAAPSKKKSIRKKLIYQLGLSGFAFGNIMLLSLPEYFDFGKNTLSFFTPWFTWINLIMATPVAIYSGQDYFRSAWRSLRNKRLNIDVPIAIGVFVLYARSSYEVIYQVGPGYFDSLCGLLFFLLLGRLFQEKVYHQLSFERDYKSYFPISVTKLEGGKETSVPVNEVKKGDRILIRNTELIPVDSYLIKGDARIDNSFATGESKPIKFEIGQKIYAGGKQIGGSIEVEAIKPLNQSRLTRLWEEDPIHDGNSHSFSKITDQISQWFTPIILTIAFGSSIFHLLIQSGFSIESFTAVLIVACPCALALSAPFTYGHAIRYLGRINCFVKNIEVLEIIPKVSHIVFDKTGTLTTTSEVIEYRGKELSQEQKDLILALVNNSIHPLSRLIKNHLKAQKANDQIIIQEYKELPGKGLMGMTHNQQIRLGSRLWILGDLDIKIDASEVYLELNGEQYGVFNIKQNYRKGAFNLIRLLQERFSLSLLSGDNESEKSLLEKVFLNINALFFEQSPRDKLNYIKHLQSSKEVIMMVGDGLNDAGALKQAEVGVSVVDQEGSFSPASDVILMGEKITDLKRLIQFSKSSKNIIYASFIISFLYNIIGLSLAVSGNLSPVIAAILMPLSSISVVLFASIGVYILNNQLLKK